MIGEKVANFEVKRLLGEGGMGAVYEASHIFMPRRVAIKVLKKQFTDDPSHVERFFNEARAASAINHPNIVEMLDAGFLANGRPYLMMELLQGESLAERLARLRRLSPAEALKLAVEGANALASTHAVGIIHRDLKPENLFWAAISHDQGRERLKILDFGIAKLREELTGSKGKTKTGTLLGTPPYMSPEHCLGGNVELDGRSDIYALGIILHECLAGAPPFVAEGFGQVMMMHINQLPPPLRSFVPGISVELEALVLCMLAKRREDRFANMTEVSAALRATPEAQGLDLRSPSGALEPTPQPLPRPITGGTRLLQTPYPVRQGRSSDFADPTDAHERQGPGRRAMRVGLGAVAVLIVGVAVYGLTRKASGPTTSTAAETARAPQVNGESGRAAPAATAPAVRAPVEAAPTEATAPDVTGSGRPTSEGTGEEPLAVPSRPEGSRPVSSRPNAGTRDNARKGGTARTPRHQDVPQPQPAIRPEVF